MEYRCPVKRSSTDQSKEGTNHESLFQIPRAGSRSWRGARWFAGLRTDRNPHSRPAHQSPGGATYRCAGATYGYAGAATAANGYASTAKADRQTGDRHRFG